MFMIWLELETVGHVDVVSINRVVPIRQMERQRNGIPSGRAAAVWIGRIARGRRVGVAETVTRLAILIGQRRTIPKGPVTTGDQASLGSRGGIVNERIPVVGTVRWWRIAGTSAGTTTT